MRPGADGFIGVRLKHAREARGVTQIFVAEKLGVTNRAVSQWEAGASRPTGENVSRLSDLLVLPQEYFFKAPQVRDSGRPVFFRSLSAATKSVRNRAEHMASWFADLVAEVESYVELPAVNIPQLSNASDPTGIRDAEIEDAADALRDLWRLGDGPISNMTYVLENHGVVVSRFPFYSESLDAFSEWSDVADRPLVLLNDEKDCAVRSRYDAAHELGHLLLHRNINRSVFNAPGSFKAIEHQAFLFAGAFMLPSEAFVRELPVPTLDAFLRLKGRWRVSIGAMIMRAQYLGLIDTDRATRLWREYSRRGYRKREPLDDALECECPVVVRQALELILDSGIPAKQLLDALPYSPADLASLAGVAAGFFDGGNAIPLRLKQRDGRSDSAKPSGQVVQFPGEPRGR